MKQFDQDLLRHWVFSAISFAAAIFLLISLCIMTGCTKTVYLPVETHSVSNDSLIQTRWLTDCRVEKDSVFVLVKGDTVLVRDTKWRTRDVEKHDTVYVARHDTVRVKEPYPVEKIVEVERKRGWWETLLLWAGGLAIAGGILLIIYRHLTGKSTSLKN